MWSKEEVVKVCRGKSAGLRVVGKARALVTRFRPRRTKSPIQTAVQTQCKYLWSILFHQMMGRDRRVMISWEVGEDLGWVDGAVLPVASYSLPSSDDSESEAKKSNRRTKGRRKNDQVDCNHCFQVLLVDDDVYQDKDE